MKSHYHSRKAYLLFIFHLIFSASKACHPTDKEALLEFKKNIASDPENLLRTWNPDTDCCKQWDSISCHASTGRVVNVSLHGPYPRETGGLPRPMCGTLSPFIGNLSSLEGLMLYQHNLTGPIPSTIHGLNKLKILGIAVNQLSGPIPETLGELKKLQTLDLSANELTGKIPESIGQLTSLTFIGLSQNQFIGEIPTGSGKLKHLDVLDLSQNHLTGPIPKEVLNLKHFTKFDISNNDLRGEIPGHKADIPVLPNIILDYVELHFHHVSIDIQQQSDGKFCSTFVYVIQILTYQKKL